MVFKILTSTDGFTTHYAASNPESVGLVPLFIITENNIRSKLVKKQDLFFNRASPFNIIPTILEIFNYLPNSNYGPVYLRHLIVNVSFIAIALLAQKKI